MPKGETQTKRAIERVGQRYGALVLESFVGSNKHRKAVFVCRCDCGNTVVKESGLLRGNSHCGCKTKERNRLANMKHGHSPRSGKTSINSIWSAMKKRCMNERNKDFKWYGGKGISVCDRWMSFENFIADMGDSFFAGATIDRIDPDGDYEPTNCRWVTHKENVSRAAIKRWSAMNADERIAAVKPMREVRYENADHSSSIKADKRNSKYRGG